MNKCLLYLSLCLFLTVGFAACDEVEEVDEYANWEQRNTAFIDSVRVLAGDRVVPLNGSGDIVDGYQIGEMFALETTASTTAGKQYVYCKKISEDQTGARPTYTDNVEVFYYGTLINGTKFDGNFEGFSATDRGTLDPAVKAPTEFDSPSSFSVSGVVTGWIVALQYMHVGDRWMLYIPYQCGYGDSDYSSIPGYSTLTFDAQLEGID